MADLPMEQVPRMGTGGTPVASSHAGAGVVDSVSTSLNHRKRGGDWQKDSQYESIVMIPNLRGTRRMK
jgi:hypothetical protein